MSENLRRMPSQDRAQQTLEAILEATAQILVQDGYARASTNRIAKRAGVSVGSLYQYFSNKDAIVDALGERVAERQLAALSSALEAHAGEPLESGIRGLVRAVLASQRVDAELSRALITQCPRDGRVELERRWMQRLTELLSASMLMASHPLRPRNFELASYVLVHALFAVVRDAIADRPELIRGEVLVEELTELVVRYLRPDG